MLCANTFRDINVKKIEQKELDDQISGSDESERFATVDLKSLDFLFNKAGLVSSQVNVLKNMTKLSLNNAKSIENVDKLIENYKIAWLFGVFIGSLNNFLGSKYLSFKK